MSVPADASRIGLARRLAIPRSHDYRSVYRTQFGERRAVDETVGARLRRVRLERGVSLSELARRSGVGKGTISELEHDRRGARLETLFALTSALGAPLGDLLAEGGAAEPETVAGASVSATLLGRWVDGAWQVEAYRAGMTTAEQTSPAHSPGVEETVTVVRGRVAVGPVGGVRELAAGESLRYRADATHTFQALDDAAAIVLLMHYPHPQEADHHAH
jgi:transcriptional regulator with XRE-family HTH domain